MKEEECGGRGGRKRKGALIIPKSTLFATSEIKPGSKGLRHLNHKICVITFETLSFPA